MLLAILGRQPKIGLAELESLYGPDKIRPIGNTAVMVDIDLKDLDHKRLGGTIKVARPLTELNTTKWSELAAYTARELPKHVCCLGEGKLKLGISTYGIDVSVQQLFRSGLDFKKVCKQAGRSTRVVPNTDLALNSAQVLHNQLAGNPLGMELLYVKNGNKTWLAQTWSVQDIDAYAKRDHGRPKRDARVGMLPPKLAQIIVNLSGAKAFGQLLDPFCGTGVILQEALLMDIDVYGSDIDPKMVDYTKENLDWFDSIHHHYRGKPESASLSTWYSIEAADATTAQFKSKHAVPIKHVASEVYLGRPLTTLPATDKLSEIIHDTNTIIEKFLKNIHPQLPKNAQLCLAVPAWIKPGLPNARQPNAVSQGFWHLPLLDHLSNLGYNRLKFKHASATRDLIYHREDQVVARELLVLTVK